MTDCASIWDQVPPSVADDGICKVRQHPWQIRVVGTSFSPHHRAMNEFVDPSQQPADNPRRRSAKWFPEPDDAPWSGVPPPPATRPEVTPARPGGSPGPSSPATRPEVTPARPGGSPGPSSPATRPEVTPARPGGSPGPSSPATQQVRLVWNDWPGEIGGVGVWNANTQSYDSVWRTRTPPTPGAPARPGTVEDRLAREVRQAFADFLAEEIRAAVCPAPRPEGMRPPGSSAELFTVVEDLLDPRLLAAELIRATVQVAALHAGIPQPVAGWMGQAAKNWFLSRSKPDPDASKVQAVQAAVDLALSAENGSVTNSPAVCKIAVDEIVGIVKRLLGPGAPPPGRLESSSPTLRVPRVLPAPPARPSPIRDGFPPM
jgi:hypothetical protein